MWRVDYETLSDASRIKQNCTVFNKVKDYIPVKNEENSIKHLKAQFWQLLTTVRILFWISVYDLMICVYTKHVKLNIQLGKINTWKFSQQFMSKKAEMCLNFFVHPCIWSI